MLCPPTLDHAGLEFSALPRSGGLYRHSAWHPPREVMLNPLHNRLSGERSAEARHYALHFLVVFIRLLARLLHNAGTIVQPETASIAS
jgi:hypothetical protein